MLPLMLLAWLGLCSAELRVVSTNLGTTFNGYGALMRVRAKVAHAPMRYRVLAAWMLGWLPVPRRLFAYLLFKWLWMLAGLLAAWPLVGPTGVFALAILMAATFEYDYWDSYVELACICLCLCGNPWAALAGAALWGMSKETVLIAPFLALYAGGTMCGLAALAGPVTLGIVRLIQGKAPLYCPRWTLRLMNVPDLKAIWRRRDKGLLLSILWGVALIGVVLLGQLPEPLRATRGLALVWILAGWMMARARETRIFLPCALWLAGMAG